MAVLFIRYWRYYGCILLCYCTASWGGSPIDVVLPKSSNPNISVNHYMIQLIEEALALEDYTANVSYSAEPMNQKRAIYSLQHQQIVNLYWLASNEELELTLRSIKIPLYKGLHGSRILLIHKSLANEFGKITTLEQLKPYIGLQKASWSDYTILINNGLTVDGSHTYEAMHKALNNRLGDYFPRSALTVLSEYQNNKTDNIMIEQNLLLQYPNNYYFFTNKQNELLAGALESGIQKLLTNGRFEEIFHQYFGKRLNGLNIQQRTVVALKK